MRSITRVLLIAFMVALLPVRGWIGDAMAVEMAADAANATKYVAQERHSTPASGSIASKNAPQAHSDCAGHGSMAQADNPQAASTQATDACQGCSACQVCHTLALAVVSAGTEPTDWTQAVPAHGASHLSMLNNPSLHASLAALEVSDAERVPSATLLNSLFAWAASRKAAC